MIIQCAAKTPTFKWGITDKKSIFMFVGGINTPKSRTYPSIVTPHTIGISLWQVILKARVHCTG